MATPWHKGDWIANRWEIYDIITCGGMGIVYIVYDHEWREPFAAKTFRDDLFARNPAIVDRFQQEARVWVNLDVHQNVTRAHFVEIIGGRPLLFLEYVSGGDLGRWIGTPRLTQDLPQVLRFALQCCDGMTHTLAKGIQAHRDIKPQNCLITQDRTLKVTDFGLAKIFDAARPADGRRGRSGEEESGHSGSWRPLLGRRLASQPGEVETPNLASVHLSLSRTGTAAGTCTHMAPEQFDDGKHVDVRADIYAFGVMLFQMLTGQLPFAGGTWDTWKRLHQTQAPPPLPPSLPAPLRTVVHACLAKDPVYRFADFRVVRERLAEIYEGLTGTSAPQPAVGKALGAIEWTDKGANLGRLKHHDEALACFDQALTLNPHYEQAWFNKGVVLTRRERDDEALACFDQALTLNPHDEQAWSSKGVVLEALERDDEALACYDQALTLNPHDEQAWFNKGVTLFALQHYHEALVCFEEAHRLGYPQAAQWIARCRQLLGG